MQRVLYLTLLVTLVAAPLAGIHPVPAAAVESSGLTPEVQAQFQLEDAGLDTERVLLRFDVTEDGAATVVVEYRLPIDEAPETTAFVDLQQDIDANQSVYLDRFERRMTETVQTAAIVTDREMTVTDVAVQAEIRQLPTPYGVVAYSFTWVGFAAVEDGDLRVGDALAGLYLEEGAQLQISWPDGYEARNVHTGVSEQRERAAIWAGPVWFDRTGPQLDLVRGGGGIDPVPVALLGVSVLFAAGGFVFWVRARRDADPATPAPSNADVPRSTNLDGGHTMTADPNRSDVDVELLSNEERILGEIERRGGRVKQRELVAALGWSDAKVSRAVTSLRKDGTLDGFRIGNENVLSLPAHEGPRDPEAES
jgi:hypothetical protein